MGFHVTATTLAILHFAFILFVAIGALLVLRWRWVMYLQLPAAIWGAVIEIAQLHGPSPIRRSSESRHLFVAHRAALRKQGAGRDLG